MYEPSHFRIEDREALFALIRAHPLGLLITGGGAGIEANPVPFTFERSAAGDRLTCHLARANPQWKTIGEGRDALVVFQGLDHYVTPAWYPAKQEHGKVVPTWNYVHVQVRGMARLREDAAFLRAQLEALTRRHEAGRETPWQVEDAPADYLAAQMRGIVGVEIAVTGMSGKFKLSQNRGEADFAGVVAGLAREEDGAGPAMADFIAGNAGLIRP